MEPIHIGLISFVFILMGALCGFYLGTKLPEHHLNHDSKDAVKMGWGIIATMSALVLSLLVASAKNTFDVVNSESTETAEQLIVLEHALMKYGPEADPIRRDLVTAVAASIKRDWPDETIAPNIPAAAQHSNLMEGIEDEVNKLKPVTDEQRESLAEAKSASSDISKRRWLIIEQSKTSLPTPLFFALVFWLTLLLFGLALYSPHNKTVLVMVILCSLSVSIAIFLINDLSHPLRGVVEISSGPMVDAFEHISQP